MVGRIIVAAGICLLLITIAGLALGVRIPLTPSLPAGIYIHTSAADSFVIVCPKDIRNYRLKGSCPDGLAPLMKQVLAKPGDRIKFSANGLVVNGKPVPNSAPVAADTQGRWLTHCPFGTGRIAPGYVWIGSAFNPRSYDSRYFCPIPEKWIVDKVKPLWLF